MAIQIVSWIAGALAFSTAYLFLKQGKHNAEMSEMKKGYQQLNEYLQLKEKLIADLEKKNVESFDEIMLLHSQIGALKAQATSTSENAAQAAPCTNDSTAASPHTATTATRAKRTPRAKNAPTAPRKSNESKSKEKRQNN